MSKLPDETLRSRDSISRDILKIQLGLLTIALVALVASFNPEWRLWGLDSFASFPVGMRIGIVLLLAITIVPNVQHRLTDGLVAHLERFSVSRPLFLYSIAGAILSVLFVILRSDSHLLGDGYLVLNNLAKGQGFSLFEPLTDVVCRAIYALTNGGEVGAALIFRIIAGISGAAFLGGLWYFLRSKSEVWISLAVALGFAAIQFFAGYIELYTLSYLFAFLYLMSAHRDLRQESLSILTIALLLLAVACHLQMGVLLPSAIYLIYRRRPSKTMLTICITAGLLALIGACVYASNAAALEHILTPLQPNDFTSYTLLTPQHLGDIANLVLLNLPVVLVLLPTKLFWKMKFGVFNLFTTVPSLLFMLLVDPKLGAIRDWDMMSVASAPLIVAVINAFASVEEVDKVRLRRLIVPLFLFAVIHTGSFIWQNTSAGSTYLHLKPVVQRDLHYSAQFDNGRRNVPWAQTAAIFQDGDEVIRSLTVRVGAEPDNAGVRYLLAMAYSGYRSDTTTAAQLVSNHWQDLSADPVATANIGRILTRAGDRNQAEKLYDKYVDSGGRDSAVCFDLAAIKESKGDPEKAWGLYRVALQSQPNPTLERTINFALISLRLGYYSEGEEALRSVILSLPLPAQPTCRELMQAIPRQNHAELDSLSRRLVESLQ